MLPRSSAPRAAVERQRAGADEGDVEPVTLSAEARTNEDSSVSVRPRAETSSL